MVPLGTALHEPRADPRQAWLQSSCRPAGLRSSSPPSTQPEDRSWVPPWPHGAQKRNLHLPPTLFSNRKHPEKRKLRQRGPASLGSAETRAAGLYRRPRSQARPSTNGSHPPPGARLCGPSPPSHKGTWTGTTGAPGSRPRPSTARVAGTGQQPWMGEPGLSHSWAGPTAAQPFKAKTRPGLCERPLLHGRNVQPLSRALPLHSAAPGRPPQPGQGPRAQLPGPGAVHSRQAPDLAWPPSHGPQGGGSAPLSRRQ